MKQEMTESQEAASLRLYEILERVGLSEKMRLRHRQYVITEIIRTTGVHLRPGKNDELYYFGSSSEGSTLDDMQSDRDCVYSCMERPVVREAGVRESLLLVQDHHTYPGYVKLQLVRYEEPMTISEMDAYGEFGPDVYGRMCLKHLSIEGKDAHGPAIDISNRESSEVPFDLVIALKCLSVSESVRQWLPRKRQYGWPSQQCIDHMSHFPHFVVGVGHPYSVEAVLEWRISYSLHERELMFSLNPTQHKCYGTMKMIKKDAIEPTVGEESISSYHLKNCVFWAIEKTPADMWRPGQLLHCINRCFWYLLYFILTKNCPNYFRPDANLFEREVFVRLQDRLSALIKDIIHTLPVVVSEIKCADVCRIFLNPAGIISKPVLIGILSQTLTCTMEKMKSSRRLTKELLQLYYAYVTQQDRVSKLYHLLHTWSRVRRITEHTEEQTDEARKLMLPCLHFRLATCLAAEGFNVNNGPLLQLSILHLTQSSTRDWMGARLMYVAILYRLGRYRHCEEILRRIDRDLQPHVEHERMCYIRKPGDIDEILNREEDNKRSIRSVLISAAISCVIFLPSERELVPEPLQYELNRSRDKPQIPSTDKDGYTIYDWACVDGKVYFHVMQYLVYSRLYSQEEKAICRNNLLDAIKIDMNLQHEDTAYNVLGWMYLQENMYTDALRCWKSSLEIQDTHNAASRHIRALFSSFFNFVAEFTRRFKDNRRKELV